MPLDYRSAYTQRLAANVAEVRAAATTGTLDEALLEKVTRYADKHGYTVAAVCAALASPGPAAQMLAATFAKDPVKQGLHETLAAGYVAAMTRLVREFTVLPKGGEGTLHLNADGTVTAGGGTDATSGSAVKSIDFTWRTGPYRVFALHKWTNEDGGGQKHQEDEARRFLAAAAAGARGAALAADVDRADAEGNVPQVFIAICDGDYYRRARRDGTSRVAGMAAAAADLAHVHATDIDHLGQLLRRLHDPRAGAGAAW